MRGGGGRERRQRADAGSWRQVGKWRFWMDVSNFPVGNVGRESLFYSRRLEIVPPGVYLEVTKRCNLSCKYCYARREGCNGDIMNTPQILGIIGDIKNSGNTFLIISGGEPLIREDIFSILDFSVLPSDSIIDTLPFPVSLITNATLITPDLAEKLSSYPSLQVRVSLDGHAAEYHDPVRGEGSFRKTMTGIKNLLKAGMRKQMSLCSTVSSLNVKVMGETVKKAVGMGIGSLVVTPVARQGEGAAMWEDLKISPDDLKNMFDELHELEEKYSGRIHISGSMKSSLLKSLQEASNFIKCPVGQRVAIDASGGVYPCSLMMFPEFLCGNVLREPLKKILACEKMKSFKDCALQRAEKIPQCACCRWKEICAGGCMARAYGESGDLFSTDPDCGVIVRIAEADNRDR